MCKNKEVVPLQCKPETPALQRRRALLRRLTLLVLLICAKQFHTHNACNTRYYYYFSTPTSIMRRSSPYVLLILIVRGSYLAPVSTPIAPSTLPEALCSSARAPVLLASAAPLSVPASNCCHHPVPANDVRSRGTC